MVQIDYIRLIIFFAVEIIVLLIINWDIYKEYGDKQIDEEMRYWGKKGEVKTRSIIFEGLNLLVYITVYFFGLAIIWYIVQDAIKSDKIFWNDMSELCNDILSDTLTIVIGITSMLGIIVGINKNYYITFSIKDIIYKLKFKEKIVATYVCTALIVIIHFVSPIFEWHHKREVTASCKLLKVYCFLSVVFFCGKIAYDLITIILSETKFEYECLKDLNSKIWRISVIENIETQNISTEGTKKDVSYLCNILEKNIKKTKGLVEISFHSNFIEMENSSFKFKDRAIWATLILVIDIILCYQILDVNLGTFIVGIMGSIMLLLLTYGWFKLKRPNGFLLSYASQCFCVNNREGTYKRMIIGKNRKYRRIIYSMIDLLSLYKFFLLCDIEANDKEKTYVNLLDLFEKEIRKKISLKADDEKVLYYVIILLTGAYLRYEVASDEEKEKVIQNVTELLRDEKNYFLGYYEKNENIIKQWMNALVSSINRETDPNDIKKLKNTELEKFYSKLEEKNGLNKCMTYIITVRKRETN